MRSLVEHVDRSIRSHGLFRPSEPILVAVSGGVDSMVLLRVLGELSPAYDWRLTVAHLNHQLRGRSSDADESLVRHTAQELGFESIVGRVDVGKFAKTEGLSLEMAARKARHRFLARTAARKHIATTALAHHVDDQLELFFLRLLRGTGGEGLVGMKWRNPSPVLQEIHLVRPLLDLPKTALRQYAADFKIKFREDESNACPDIPRNRIRHHLLPLLKQLQPALETTLLRTMAVIGAETDFVGQTARDWLAQRTPDSFKELHVAIQRRCVQLQLLDLGLVPNFELVEQLRLAGAKPVSVSLAQPEPTQTKHESPLGVVCDANGIVSLRPPKPDTFTTTTLALNLGKTAGNALFGGLRVKWAILRQKASKPLRAIPGQEYFDADKVGSKIRLRHWQPGDRFQPSGMSKGVKLQDLFVNHKIPQQQRHSLVVAQTAANEVFWVEGLRISERFKLAKTTNRRLHWQWRRV